MFAYLNDDALEQIRQILIDRELTAHLRGLASRIDRRWVAQNWPVDMPQSMQAFVLLERLNGVERLANGTVPLRQFLEALRLETEGGPEQANITVFLDTVGGEVEPVEAEPVDASPDPPAATARHPDDSSHRLAWPHGLARLGLGVGVGVVVLGALGLGAFLRPPAAPPDSRAVVGAAPPDAVRAAVTLDDVQGCVGEAAANRRALVIGNRAYTGLRSLANPVFDAAAVAQALAAQGYAVRACANLTRDEMWAEVTRATSTQGGDLIVFFAGHGYEVDGQNLLIGVDFQPQDQDPKGQAVLLQDLVRRAEGIRTLVILDACRSAPFLDGRGGEPAGFVKLKDLPVGHYIAFSAQSGTTAWDGPPGAHSPFTRAFLELLPDARPATQMDVDRLFTGVRKQLVQASARQRSDSQNQLIAEWYPAAAATVAVAPDFPSWPAPDPGVPGPTP